jgi:aspartyl/asparaginyl beta-hydroxylase (cupin superfamily)
MKIKSAIILVASVAFLADFFLGCNRTKETMSKLWMHDHLYWNHVHSSQELERVVLILIQFREGNSTNGVTMLEKCLDGSLMAAASSDADLKDRKGSVPTYIQEAHDYRVKYPWTNSVPEVNAKIRGILSLAK